MKKLLLFCSLTVTLSTIYCAQESKAEMTARLNHVSNAIANGINKDPSNAQALKELCRSFTELLKQLGLNRNHTIDDVLTTDGTSILNALLNSVIKLNLQEFPYDTLKLLLDHGASHNTDTSFFGALLDIEKAGEEGKSCPPWIESVGNFTCSWCKEHDIDNRGGDIALWRKKHDAMSLAQEREERAARTRAREKKTGRCICL